MEVSVNLKGMLSKVGLGLVIFGVILIIAQIVWPDRFTNKPILTIFGASLQTDFLGFAVLFVGAILLVTAAFGKQKSDGS
jgi:hypothetical protein